MPPAGSSIEYSNEVDAGSMKLPPPCASCCPPSADGVIVTGAERFFAEMAAADLLLEQQPITNPVLGAAVRQVLAEDPDVYRPVAQHEATEAALAALGADDDVGENGKKGRTYGLVHDKREMRGMRVAHGL